MKRLTLVLFLVYIIINVSSRTYPFQDRNLSEDERIRNLISQMTLNETKLEMI